MKKVNESEVKEKLMFTFSGNFCLDEVKKLMTDEVLVTKICDKYAFLNSEKKNDATFSVIRSWTSERYTGTSIFKNVMIKCSPQISKHIMKDNDGYVYAELSRCRGFDHFFVPQCYQCYKFNYFAGECPDKDMPGTCGKCAGRRKTKDCNRYSPEKCVNCVQNRERNFKHDPFSRECPAMVKG